MKVGLVAPLEESVPPRAYGGTELVVYNLAEELVALGHDVTLFASGDSATSAMLQPIFPRSLRSDTSIHNLEVRDAMKLVGLGRTIELLHEADLDIIHNNTGWRLLPFARQLQAPVLSTFHGPLTPEHYKCVLEEFTGCPFVSISNAQRTPAPNANYVATVYNGIDCSSFEYNLDAGTYLVFLGRFSPEKGPVTAIEAARQAGIPLIMAGKVDTADKAYFESHVKPLIDGSSVKFVGEVNHVEKNQLLKDATALLMPIEWEEPFGLVMIEAFASGTPVIAHRRGSVPEIVVPERVGFISDTLADMVSAIKRIDSISRQRCRDYVCEKFSRQAMAAGYVASYEKVLESTRPLEQSAMPQLSS